MRGKFVSYLRVSTYKQGQTGDGIDGRSLVPAERAGTRSALVGIYFLNFAASSEPFVASPLV